MINFCYDVNMKDMRMYLILCDVRFRSYAGVTLSTNRKNFFRDVTQVLLKEGIDISNSNGLLNIYEIGNHNTDLSIEFVYGMAEVKNV